MKALQEYVRRRVVFLLHNVSQPSEMSGSSKSQDKREMPKQLHLWYIQEENLHKMERKFLRA